MAALAKCSNSSKGVYKGHRGDMSCHHKLDGTAKGGVVIGISDEFKIPVNILCRGKGG